MRILFSALLLFFATTSFSQYFSSDLTDESVPVTWLGLDFTEARLIEKPDMEVDIERFPSLLNIWNEQVVSQKAKYPLEKAFHHSTITRNIDMMKMLNSRLEGEQMVTEDLYLLYDYNIKSAFSRYNLDGSGQGIGIVFLVEAIDYAHKEFSGYMIPIDLSEKRIIKTYYLKMRFPFELEQDKLIQPFGQILLQFEEKLDEKK